MGRDEHIDPEFDQPVAIKSKDGYVLVTETDAPHSSRLLFRLPAEEGYINMVDYASVDSWKGRRICTWLPKTTNGK